MKVLFITAIALMVCSVTCISFKTFEDTISQECLTSFEKVVVKCVQDKIVPPRRQLFDETTKFQCKMECIGLGCAETVTTSECTEAEIELIRAGAKQEVQVINEGKCKEYPCDL